MYWRSRQDWVCRAITIGWVHKHPYPRSLNLKAVLPQSQTLAIAPAGPRARAAVVYVILRKAPKQPPVPARIVTRRGHLATKELGPLQAVRRVLACRGAP